MTIINFEDEVTTGDDEDAVTTDEAGEDIINHGNLTTTGNLANGIFGGANDVTVRNFADIETSGLGAAGIYVSGDNARIENYGSVHTTGDPTGDELFFSEGLFAEGNGFYVANHGSVLIEGLFASGLVGVSAGEPGGVVINYGHVDSLATGSSAIAVIADGGQAINAGLLTLRGEDNAGVFALGEDAIALNSGEIVVTGDGSVALEGVLFNTHITNRGEIHVTADSSTGMGGFGDGHEVSNFGLIDMHGTSTIGMAARGGGPFDLDGTDLVMLNAGRITTEGEFAIGAALGLSPFGFPRAEGGEITNSGTIQTEGDGAAGVVMIGDGHHLINSGRITADGGEAENDIIGSLRAAGVVVSGNDVLVENTVSGVIRSNDAVSAAVEMNVFERANLPADGMSSTLENFGRIEGAVAVLGGDGQETVINHGRIVGDVDLGDNDDMFVFGNGGTVAGNVSLGDGNDLAIIENGSGKTVIADFVAGAASGDQIDVSEFFSSFGEVTAHSRQRGNDVVINLDNNDTLVLSNVQLTALNDGDFLFV